MDKIKSFTMANFEAIVVLCIFGGVLLMNYFVIQQASFLHFYYLPVLVAGYVLGKRVALLASFLSIGLVILLNAIEPARFSLGESRLDATITIVFWGGFLVLTSYVVGLLYERKEEKVAELQQAYVGVLEILSKYIEGNDRYTQGHSLRVSHMAAQVARAMDLTAEQIENCRVAGLLHDIGKVEISIDLIRKAADLTEEERRLIDTHAEKGARMIDSLGGILKDVVPVIETHHTPYRQDGVENDQVPIEAFIVAVVDAYDAMITDRPYRAGKQPYEAMSELEKCSGTQFSPGVIAAFKRVMTAQREEIEALAQATHVI